MSYRNMTVTEMVDHLMKEINFEAIRDAMHATNWCWRDNPEPPHYRDIYTLCKKHLEEIADLCLADKTRKVFSLSTGGFTWGAEKQSNEADEIQRLWATFTLTDGFIEQESVWDDTTALNIPQPPQQ